VRVAEGDPDEAMMLVQRQWRAQVPAHVSPQARPCRTNVGRVRLSFFWDRNPKRAYGAWPETLWCRDDRDQQYDRVTPMGATACGVPILLYIERGQVKPTTEDHQRGAVQCRVREPPEAAAWDVPVGAAAGRVGVRLHACTTSIQDLCKLMDFLSPLMDLCS